MSDRLQKLVDKLLVEGFPELRQHDITAEFKKGLSDIMSVGALEDEGWYIEVDKELKKASDEVLIGGLAHELVHMVKDFNRSFLEHLLYRFSNRFKEAIERDTDIETILRGYGDQLLAFTQHVGEDWSRYRTDGLAGREIEKILDQRIQ